MPQTVQLGQHHKSVYRKQEKSILKKMHAERCLIFINGIDFSVIPLITVLTERTRFISCTLMPGSSPNPPILWSTPQPTKLEGTKQ